MKKEESWKSNRSEHGVTVNTHVGFKCLLSVIFNFDAVLAFVSQAEIYMMCGDFWLEVSNYCAFLRLAEKE